MLKLLIVLLLISGTAIAHEDGIKLMKGEKFWSEKYQVESKYSGKISCCDESDLHFIPMEQASQLQVGSKYPIQFGGVLMHITVKVIYPSEDPQGRAAISNMGCLFKPFSM